MCCDGTKSPMPAHRQLQRAACYKSYCSQTPLVLDGCRLDYLQQAKFQLGYSFFFLQWYGKEKCCAFTNIGLSIDFSLMLINDFLANSQANTCSFIFISSMKLLKYLK